MVNILLKLVALATIGKGQKKITKNNLADIDLTRVNETLL